MMKCWCIDYTQGHLCTDVYTTTPKPCNCCLHTGKIILKVNVIKFLRHSDRWTVTDDMYCSLYSSDNPYLSGTVQINSIVEKSIQSTYRRRVRSLLQLSPLSIRPRYVLHFWLLVLFTPLWIYPFFILCFFMACIALLFGFL